jgi:hypothetical protein
VTKEWRRAHVYPFKNLPNSILQILENKSYCASGLTHNLKPESVTIVQGLNRWSHLLMCIILCVSAFWYGQRRSLLRRLWSEILIGLERSRSYWSRWRFLIVCNPARRGRGDLERCVLLNRTKRKFHHPVCERRLSHLVFQYCVSGKRQVSFRSVTLTGLFQTVVAWSQQAQFSQLFGLSTLWHGSNQIYNEWWQLIWGLCACKQLFLVAP